MRHLHVICTPSPNMAKCAVKNTPIGRDFLGIDGVVDKMRGMFYDPLGAAGVERARRIYHEGEIEAALSYMLSAVKNRTSRGVDVTVEYPAMGTPVPDSVDNMCHETINEIVREAVACGYAVTLHDLVVYRNISFGPSVCEPCGRYGAYDFEVKRRSQAVRAGVDKLLSEYQGRGCVVQRFYDYDYSRDSETADVLAEVCESVKRGLFSSRCVDMSGHPRGGKIVYLTVGDNYDSFRRGVNKALAVMPSTGLTRCLTVMGDYFKHANGVDDVTDALGALYRGDLASTNAVSRLVLLEGESDYLLRRALVLGEENSMSHVAALCDAGLRERVLSFLSHLTVASVAQLRDKSAPNGWRFMFASNRVASAHDALCVIGNGETKVQARALMDSSRFVRWGAYTDGGAKEDVEGLFLPSIAEDCQGRGDLRMVNASERGSVARDYAGGVVKCMPQSGESIMIVESFGLRENTNS